MKLLLFILGIALITASPTYRGLNNDLSDQVVPLTQDDPTALDDDLDWLFDDGDFDGDFDVDNNGENAEELLEYCLEEETVFPSEEEEVISGEEEQEEEDLLAEIRSDTLVSDIFDFAVSIVLSDGVQEGKIPNVTFTVTEVSVYNKTAGTDGDLYEFSCEATNNNGSVIDINLTVYYDFATARRVVSSYSYSIETTTVTQPGNPGTPSGNNNYTQVSEEEIDTNALIQSVVEYGVAQIYAIGTNAGKIPVADYAITSIVSVWEQVTQTGANYQCSVVLENNTSTNNVTINANFTISYVTASQQSTMTAYSYTVNQVTTTNPGNNTGNTGNNGTNTTTNTTDGFASLSADEIANSAEVQSALAYGVDQVLASGYTKGKIPQSDYEITKINSVQRKTEAKRTTYKCNVELEDINDVLIKAQFTVFVNAKTQVNTIGAWSYTISNIRPSTGNYTALSAAEIASADVQAVLNFGADQIVTSGIAKGKIPQSDYNITKVNSVARKSSTNQFTYKCNVELEDVKEVLIKTEFYVYVNRDTQVLSIGSWSYNVSNIKPGNTTTGNTTTPTQPTNTTNTTSPGNTTTPTQPTNTTNTTTPGNTTTPTTGDYVQLTSDQIANSEVQGVLNYGVNQILTSGYAKGKIPQSDYAITLVNSVLRKNDTKKTTYNCSIELQDSKKVVIKANFTVNVKLSNQEMSIVGWSYNIYNIPKNNTSTTTNTTQPTTNSTTTTSNTTSSTGTNTTTSSNTTTSTNTTTPTTPVNTNTTTTTNSTNSTANDGFVALTSDQIANDAEVQSLLNYATGQIIQSGESKGKIPQSTYQISKVNSVLKKADTNKNTYKCDVELQDTKNVVKTQFTVWIKPATQDKGLTAWSYSIGPIGN